MALKTEREKTAHLLRRFGLGASEAELDYYGKDGHKGAIDRLLAFAEAEEGASFDVQDLANQNGQINMKAVQIGWYLRIVATRRPLQEKLTLFWHDHFATSAAKVDAPMAMHDQVQILRENCCGRFHDLLTKVSKDPAMLYWLDNQFNVKGKPNENFAREVMELFTLGIGHYTEKDVQEAARAFTGWSFGIGPRAIKPEKPLRRARFVFRENEHDTGVKTILGNTGPFDGDDVLGILCGNPRTAEYITEKMWEWFAYPKPEKAILDRLAARFRESGLNIATLVRAIMESPEFYSEKAERAIYKNPIDFCVATYRQLGIGERILTSLKEIPDDQPKLRAMAPVNGLTLATKAMGMELLFPPDVAGWDTGEGWISSATMVERIKWAERLFGPATLGRLVPGAARAPSIRYPAAQLIEGLPPSEAVDKIVSIFDAALPAAKIDQLRKAAETESGGVVTNGNANAVALAICRLIFAAPEFQFC